MNGIPQVDISNLVQAGLGTGGAAQPSSKSNNLFQQFVKHTNNEQHAADNIIRDFIENKEGTSIQQVVMAVSQAEMSFQFFMEVRNKLIDSYSDLMRMQF